MSTVAESTSIIKQIETESYRNHARAVELATQALESGGIVDELERIRARFLRADCLRHIGRVEEASEEFQAVVELAGSAGAEQLAAKAQNGRAITAFLIGDIGSALKGFMLARDRFHAIGAADGEIQCLANAAAIHDDAGDIAGALAVLREARALAEGLPQTRRPHMLCHVLSNLVNVYRDLGQHEQALACALESLEQAGLCAEESAVAETRYNVALSFEKLGRLDEASQHLELMLSWAESSGSLVFEGLALGGLATLARKRGDVEQAIALRRRALDAHERSGSTHHIAQTSRGLARDLQSAGRPDEAVESWARAERISRERNARDDVREALAGRAEALLASGDAAAAAEAYREAEALRVELESIRRENQARHLAAVVAVEESEARARQLRADRDRLAAELRIGQSHLAEQAAAIARHRRTLGEMRSRIVSLISRSDSVAAAARAVSAMLAVDTGSTRDVELYEEQFERIHPGFRDRLFGRFPALTRTESKVAESVLLRLTAADSAVLLNVSERTIETHRLNIRRKMGLKPGEDLREALASLAV